MGSQENTTGKKKIKCRLAANQEYGRAIREGKSKTVYEFSVNGVTEILESDLAGFRDKKSNQYVKHLEVLDK